MGAFLFGEDGGRRLPKQGRVGEDQLKHSFTRGRRSAVREEDLSLSKYSHKTTRDETDQGPGFRRSNDIKGFGRGLVEGGECERLIRDLSLRWSKTRGIRTRKGGLALNPTCKQKNTCGQKSTNWDWRVQEMATGQRFTCLSTQGSRASKE